MRSDESRREYPPEFCVCPQCSLVQNFAKKLSFILLPQPLASITGLLFKDLINSFCAWYPSATKLKKWIDHWHSPVLRTAKSQCIEIKYQELAAFVLALRGTPVTKPMLYFCDNQALMKAVNNIDKRRHKNNVSRSTRRRHVTGSNQQALKKDDSRSTDIYVQSKSA